MKRKIAVGAGIAVYLGLSAAVAAGAFGKPESQTEDAAVTTDTEEAQSGTDLAIAQKSFAITDNQLAYAEAGQSDVYVETDELKFLSEDKLSILSRYDMPELERMSAEDAVDKMADLQVLKKIEVLGIDRTDFYTPEYNWKAIYNESLVAVKDALDFDETVEFNGTTASELNAFLEGRSQVRVEVTAAELTLDETIDVPSDVWLSGTDTALTGDGEDNVTYGILIEDAGHAAVSGMQLKSGFDYGIYIINSNQVLIRDNEVANAALKGICVMDANTQINLINNSVHDNGNGAIFFNGEITGCIIQGNTVYQNRGTRNLTAGIVFSSMIVKDKYTAYNEFLDEYLYDLKETPNHNVVKDNLIQGNYSSGFYSDGAYMNYVIDNCIEDNEKEGMCLDYGTFGTYVSGNTIRRNGDRNRQTDEDLEADFILGAGRLADGSSTAKLPGISIDNSAYNIVYNNNINENSGSGVKMVRSGYRNLILSNLITDNNAGENEAYHGFGVELGHASEPDEPVKGLDFTADYENIVARNVISGHHYSGIYIAQDDYCNDLIDNVIMDCEQFSVENFSDYFNSAVGNNTNVGTLNFQLQ